MFLVRQSKPEDVFTLVKLARMVFFINLPPSEQMLRAKIEHSTACFQRVAGVKQRAGSAARTSRRRTGAGWADGERDSDLFMFSIEDSETRGVIGTSQLRAHQGGPGNPNWTFKISEKVFRSERLGWGSTHKVGQLFGDESKPTEIGGLILEPSYRGHQLRPGRLLSFMRFHWIALHRPLFADRILAEMMGPVSSDGDSVFWDNFGRKFIPVRFGEADRFCQHNRGFISDLLPKEEIYLSLFPLEVQNVIGAVGAETMPAKRLLELLGFTNRGFVDPFDGGPHMDASTDEVPLVRQTRMVEAAKCAKPDRATSPALVSVLTQDGEFRGTETRVEAGEDVVRLLPEVMELLGIRNGAKIGFTPMDNWSVEAPTPAKSRKRAAPRARKKVGA